MNPLNKFYFIHINKTGGTSIKNAIGIDHHIKPKHQTYRDLEKKTDLTLWQNSFKFTFVRNPWDKVVSHYHYRLKRNIDNIKSNEISFSDWVNQTYGGQNHSNIKITKMFFPQTEWLINQNGKIELDFIGRFENIQEDFKTLAQKLQIDAELPHLNPTDRGPYRSYYDSTTKHIIRRWFESDIDYFKYTF